MNLSKRVGIAVAFQLFFLFTTRAQQYIYNYTPGCTQAMDAISKLQLPKARTLLAEERKKAPHNLALDYLDDCADYYELITCADKNLLGKLSRASTSRISRLHHLSETNPFAAYAEAEISLHSGILKLMQEEYVSGALELRTAYQLHQKNIKKFPTFYLTHKSLGFIKCLLGTLPENYTWILNIVGLKGNYTEGMQLLETYFEHRKLNPEYELENQQADFYYVLLQFYFGNKTIAWNHAQLHTLDYAENTMSCYLRAFTASHTGRTDEAIQILMKRPRGEEYTRYHQLDYLLGYAKLNKIDFDADIAFKKFVTFSQNIPLKKDAYRRLSWSELLQHDTLKFVTYRHLAFSLSSYKDDEDIWVDKELEKGIYPHAEVLKARLLFDGGYFLQAEETIKNIPFSSLRGVGQQAEYYYRYGRIMQEQKKYNKAIEYFTQSINLAEPKGLYFAPYSTLQLGNIYARLTYTQTARYFFNKAIGYKNYKGQGYITQKAKHAISEMQGPENDGK